MKLNTTLSLAFLSLTVCSNAVLAQDTISGTFTNPATAGSTADLEMKYGSAYFCYLSDYEGSYRLSKTVTSPTGQEIQAIHPAVNEDFLKQRYDDAFEFGDSSLGNNLIAFATAPEVGETGNYKITLQAIAEGSEDVNVRVTCIENAMACSFNTFVNDFNFLEVTNNGTETAVVSYLATDFSGEQTSATGFVEAGKRADFNVHEAVGPNKYGSLIVQPQIAGDPTDYFGFGGSVSARLSQYKGANLALTEPCQRLPFNRVFEEEEDDDDDVD